MKIFFKPIQELELPERAVIISDSDVASLIAHDLNAPLFTFPAGEQSKTRETKIELEDQLFEHGCGRDSTLVAVGGGVTTDLAGYIAATFCRGIPLIFIPTSLLAMVDASIGGKTGVNTYKGKNLIGANYLPEKIWIDPTLAISQPYESYRDGLVEMIKHGLIADLSFFEWIEKKIDKLIQKDPELLQKGIQKSIQIKQTIVEEDQYETGLRRILNFGHTVGHGIETLTNYTISHGEAVAAGCIVESHLSNLPQDEIKRIQSLFEKIGYHFSFNIPIPDLLSILTHDKKALGGVPRFVTLDRIGHASYHDGQYCTPKENDALYQSLKTLSK